MEKKWGNPDDSGFTYVADDGERVLLTPSLLLEWARAIVSPDSFIEFENSLFSSTMATQQLIDHQTLFHLILKFDAARSSLASRHHHLPIPKMSLDMSLPSFVTFASSSIVQTQLGPIHLLYQLQ